MSAIDVNEGVSIRQHPLGMQVFMYKKRPGQYFNQHGNPVPDVLAAQAGFPTERHARERTLMERQAKALEALEKEFRDEATTDVIAERGGFKLIHQGYDRYQVQDEHGNGMATKPMTKAEAQSLFDMFAPPPAKPTKASGPEAKAV